MVEQVCVKDGTLMRCNTYVKNGTPDSEFEYEQLRKENGTFILIA